MTEPLRIDFVSDVSCPWCAIGLLSLQQAIAAVAPAIEVDLQFQPFELNPDLPAGGYNATAHLAAKYGIDFDQVDRNRDAIRERGAALGFAFNFDRESRVYNTFDAHRLLHWAGEHGADAQLALKRALLTAYFSDNEDVSDHDTLVALAVAAGLDGDEAAAVLASDRHADDVRTQETFFTSRGIRSVPAVIINGQHLISGGQPPELFERALREIAATPGTPG